MRLPNPVIRYEDRFAILVEALDGEGVVTLDFAPICRDLRQIQTVDEVFEYVYKKVLPSVRQK